MSRDREKREEQTKVVRWEIERQIEKNRDKEGERFIKRTRRRRRFEEFDRLARYTKTNRQEDIGKLTFRE